MAASRRLLKPLASAVDSTQRVRRIADALHDTTAALSASAATTASAPATAPAPTTTAKPKTIDDLSGPPSWPVVGNFWLYIKKENRGRLHEAMVSLCCVSDVLELMFCLFKNLLTVSWFRCLAVSVALLLWHRVVDFCWVFPVVT